MSIKLGNTTVGSVSPTATNSVMGVSKPDNVTITISNGVLSAQNKVDILGNITIETPV